jgi:hypothetical protein
MQINPSIVFTLTHQRWSRPTFSLSLALLVCRSNIHPSHYFPSYFLLAKIKYIKYRLSITFYSTSTNSKLFFKIQQKVVQSTMVGVRLRTLAMFTVPLTCLGCLIAPSSSCNQQPDHHQVARPNLQIYGFHPLLILDVSCKETTTFQGLCGQ